MYSADIDADYENDHHQRSQRARAQLEQQVQQAKKRQLEENLEQQGRSSSIVAVRVLLDLFVVTPIVLMIIYNYGFHRMLPKHFRYEFNYVEALLMSLLFRTQDAMKQYAIEYHQELQQQQRDPSATNPA
jgi:hypothetical protein